MTFATEEAALVMQGLPQEDVLTPGDLYAWLRKEPETRWVEKNIKRIPGRFKAGREWRFKRSAIELNIIRTGNVLEPRG